MNQYVFCANNPVNFVDPSGLCGGSEKPIGYGGGRDGLWFNRLGDYAGETVDEMATGMAVNGVPAWIGVPVTVFLRLGEGMIRTPQAIGNFGGGFGRFSADPSLENAQYVAGDVAVGAGVLAGGMSVRSATGGSCFTRDTEVATEDGYKPIGEIQIGDEVLTWDESTDNLVVEPVTNVFQRTVDEIFTLLVGGETIETTPEHPFWVVDKGWVKVKELRSGDLFRAPGGQTLMLTDIRSERRLVTVYNIEVGSTHTYFVSRERVLVHNKAAPSKAPQFSKNPKYIMKRLGIDKRQFNEAIHDIKSRIPGNPDVNVDVVSGDVFDPRSGEWIGNLRD
jgi:hypothetical protein